MFRDDGAIAPVDGAAPIGAASGGLLADAAVDAAETPPGSAAGAGSRLELPQQGWVATDFVERAKTDPDFAARLAGLMVLCTLLDGKAPPDRFDDPRWLPYRRECQDVPHEQLLADGGISEWALPDGLHWELLTLADELPQGYAERTGAAADVLASSDDLYQLRAASRIYFDDQKILTATRERPNNLLRHNIESLRMDASMVLACQFAAGGCAWDSTPVLLECAATPGCFPGASMAQIVALRRSPQEMELLRALVAEVGRLRGST